MVQRIVKIKATNLIHVGLLIVKIVTSSVKMTIVSSDPMSVMAKMIAVMVVMRVRSKLVKQLLKPVVMDSGHVREMQLQEYVYQPTRFAMIMMTALMVAMKDQAVIMTTVLVPKLVVPMDAYRLPKVPNARVHQEKCSILMIQEFVWTEMSVSHRGHAVKTVRTQKDAIILTRLRRLAICAHAILATS
jgi:hypothetical protein